MLQDSPTGRCLEIEITPEMIAAGEREFARFDSDYATNREGVEIILIAALTAGGYISRSDEPEWGERR